LATPTHNSSSGWAGGIAAVVATIVVFVVVTRGDEPTGRPRDDTAPAAIRARPTLPPGPGDTATKAAAVVEPTMPVLTPAWKAEVAEEVRGTARPGHAAFRRVSDLYVDENLALAERQAAAEGLTLSEVRELTYFGLLTMATQRFEDVEEVTGRPLTDADRTALGELMHSSNAEFRTAMRALVKQGGSEAARWELIRATQASYLAQLFARTGLDADRLDELLAGDLALPGAPARNEPPSGEPAVGGRDEAVTPPPRPLTP